MGEKQRNQIQEKMIPKAVEKINLIPIHHKSKSFLDEVPLKK